MNTKQRPVTVWHRAEQRWVETTERYDTKRMEWRVNPAVRVCNCGAGHVCNRSGVCGY